MATVTTLPVSPAPNMVMIEIKSVYGENKAYPICARAKLFAEIAGTTTLTARTLELIRDMGFEVRERYGRPLWPTR